MATEEQAGVARQAGKPRPWLKIVLAVVAVVLIAAVAYVAHAVWAGDMAPADAAAKYDGFNYLPEGEVTDYIATYREQMGLAESSDEDWATFLAAYNLTPQRLRYTTIQQLITDALVRKKAQELGLEADEAEVDASVQALRDTLGLGDDDILQQTLEAHGQTEEGLREVYRAAIVKRLLLSAEVETPVPTDEQVKDYLKGLIPTLESTTVRHTYCFKLDGVAESGDADKISLVQKLRRQFLAGEETAENFAALVQAYSNDAELLETGGANGWDIDSSALSSSYLGVLEGLGKGDVSNTFRDGESYCFVWVDDDYTLPTGDAAIDALELSSMPDSLRRYFSDSEAYVLWEEAGTEYLAQLLEDADVVYYPMPADVPYNVDMSLADVQLEEVDAEVGGEGAASAAEGAPSAGAAESGSSQAAGAAASGSSQAAGAAS